MATRISGVLIDGFGEPIANAQMRAVSLETGETVVGSSAYTRTGEDGSYDFALEMGSYSFSIWLGSLGYQYVGDIHISGNTPDCALDDALSLPSSVQPMVLTKVLQAMVDAQNAANSAAQTAADDVRRILIPLSKQYMTLAAAQADISNIPNGSVTYVRSPDGSSLADEYINNDGTLMATGRRMPSQEYVDNGFARGGIVESDTDVAIAMTFADGSRSWLESGYDGRPTEHAAQIIGDVVKVGDSPVSNDEVAVAILFADGSRSWLESGYDGGPTEHATKLIGKAINVGESPTTDADVAIAMTFADGSRSWLESGYDGRPTEHSAKKIAEAVSENLPSFENQTVPLSTAPYGASREYPTFERLSAPIIRFSGQSAPTVYWPWLVNKAVWGGTGFALFYSTDHSATHDPSGIFLFEADDIDGPWVNKGKIYRDDAGGWQTETPSVIYDPVSNKVLMYYQQAGVPGAIGQQQTCLATADPADLTAWTRVGVVLDKEFLEQPGDGHCGYFRPFSYNGQLFGYSLYGGTNYSNAALWTSEDGGYTWRRDGRLIGWMQDKCRHLSAVLGAEPQEVLLTMYEGDVLNWRGKPWWVGVSGKAQSGSVLIRHFRLVTAPLADDFASLTSMVKDITPSPAAYEVQTDIDYPGNCVAVGNAIYMAYRTGGQKGDISLMRLN